MTFDDVKKKLLEDPVFRAEYEKYDLAFEIAQAVIDGRVAKGITQQELGIWVNTKQSSIARLESGTTLPSLNFLTKIANELDLEVKIIFEKKK